MNELKVISSAKELSRVIFEITEKSPKKFRFTLVSRLQNLSLEVVSCLYRANDTYMDTKILSDMDKTIRFIRDIKKFSSEEERIHYKNKLFLLRLRRAEKAEEKVNERLKHSLGALTALREIDWLVTLAAQQQCITGRQQERIARLLYEERRLIGGFIKSDKKRFNK